MVKDRVSFLSHVYQTPNVFSFSFLAVFVVFSRSLGSIKSHIGKMSRETEELV